jgi:hypothetical protein
MRNPGFPAPSSNDGNGNINWTAASINAFQTHTTSAKANGWVVSVASYPVADWAFMAATPIGATPRDVGVSQDRAQQRGGPCRRQDNPRAKPS